MTKTDDLWDFHVVGKVHTQKRPEWPSDDEVRLRVSLIDEEHAELGAAIEQRNMAMTADALVDLVYVCIGTAVSLGIPFDAVWREVHQANMAKFAGDVIKRADGKVLKPEGWEPPDVVGVLRRYGWQGDE